MIKFQTYNLNNLILTNQLLESYINKFWNDVFSPVKDSKHLMIMCKVEFNDCGYKTLGELRRVNFDDNELFIEYLLARLGTIIESYTPSQLVTKITFSYAIKSGLATDNRRLLQDLSSKTTTTHTFNNLKLPISMNPTDYGSIIVDNHHIESEGINRFIVNAGTKNYQIDISLDGLTNKVSILGAIDLTWIDTKISDEIFKRDIGKSTITFMGGEKVLNTKQLNAKPFKKQNVDQQLVNTFVTMDIETITQNNNLSPYLICAYNGTTSISSYGELINGVINQKALFNSFINQLLTFFTSESNVITVYAHNLSGFDGIFLMKHLFSFGKVEPLLFNGRIICIKVKLNIDGYKNKTIIFKDSYLLLPLGLRKLCDAFSVKASKSFFPFLLTNILYKGIFPKFEYWTGITFGEYTKLLNEYTGKIWNFKEESIKYCILDCVSLHEIINKFNELIFSNFNVNIHIPLTLPALAMRIYKSQYMPENTIYQLLGNIEKDIRQSYTGGSVDVYIPHNRITSFFSKIKALFKKIYIYDANSLYPFVMANTAMPVGKPIAFKGDIRKMEPDSYGFFYCKINSPKYLEHPILQRRIKTSNGIRTIAGLGSWTGWIYSGEMDNAIKFGYTFEIIKGYKFEKGYIFKEYVDKMYNLRLEYDKGTPMNLIAKLLMNSLYGKFAMKLETTKVDIFDTSNEFDTELLKDMMDLYGESIRDYIKLDNFIVTVRNSLVHYEYNENEDMFHGFDVNIAIASAVTAGGRMWMSIFKNNPIFNLYYSDTDSAAVDSPLPSYMVGEGLGQFKLENVAERAVFLAPKVYALITEDGREIVKGLSNKNTVGLNFSTLENLLHENSYTEFSQIKNRKHLIEGEIRKDTVAYTLMVTANKRQLMYENGIFNSTFIL